MEQKWAVFFVVSIVVVVREGIVVVVEVVVVGGGGVVVNHLCFKELYFSSEWWYFVDHRVPTRWSRVLIHLDHLSPLSLCSPDGWWLLWAEYIFKVAVICYSSESEGLVDKRKTWWVIYVEEYLKCFVCYYNNNNNNNIYLLQLGCHPVAVVILHVCKIWNWLLLNLSREGYMRSM